MSRLMTLSKGIIMLVYAFTLSSCVHEWPEINNGVEVRMKVHHDLPWTEYEYTVDTGTRNGSVESRWNAVYTFHAYRRGATSAPDYRFTITSDDLSLSDFETVLRLPPGDWDIYCWQDLECDSSERFYDFTDFGSITYLTPYRGDTDKRDAFEGRTQVSVPETASGTLYVQNEITLKRPMAKYVFISTDFSAFFKETLSRYDLTDPLSWEHLTPDQRQDALNGFSVVVRYPFYMPATYSMFDQTVTDSWNGISYPADIRPLNSQEAVIAFDYVLMSPLQSGAQVQLLLKSPEGKLTAMSPVITVPLLRGRITYVRGKFLTTSAGSGLDIDFSFSGDFNIKIE